MAFEIDPDYKEVAERIDDLYEKYPDATLEGDYVSVAFGATAYIVYTARCWRHPDDVRPSVGIAMEQIPGTTNFTRGSEIQNAETSAWGRAIVAAGASRSKKIASADEVRSARAREQAPEPRTAAAASVDRVDQIRADVLVLEIQGWVKEQQFGWPWSVEECEFIEAKIASEREKLALAGVQATAVSEPVMSRAESLEADPQGDLAKRPCSDCGLLDGKHTDDCPAPF